MMKFTKNIPTKPGFYAWRKSASESTTFAVEVTRNRVSEFNPHAVSLEAVYGWSGEWCELVPKNEIDREIEWLNRGLMSYNELTYELTKRPPSQLPALALHIARLCGIHSVFKDKEAFLRSVGKYYDLGPVGDAELRAEDTKQ